MISWHHRQSAALKHMMLLEYGALNASDNCRQLKRHYDTFVLKPHWGTKYHELFPIKWFLTWYAENMLTILCVGTKPIYIRESQNIELGASRPNQNWSIFLYLLVEKFHTAVKMEIFIELILGWSALRNPTRYKEAVVNIDVFAMHFINIRSESMHRFGLCNIDEVWW